MILVRKAYEYKNLSPCLIKNHTDALVKNQAPSMGRDVANTEHA